MPGPCSFFTQHGWSSHERPYFDQLEKLEFPNETWAAQEFRKANVIRSAAAHTGEPLRSALVHRGAELTDRAWHDLLRFDSRHSARTIAILLTEGMRLASSRGQPEPRLRESPISTTLEPLSFSSPRRRGSSPI